MAVDTKFRPRRSCLYMPGANARALEKAKSLPADVLILDLEDAVAPDAKQVARGTIHSVVSARSYGDREVVIRINGLDTEWGEADARAFAGADCDALLLPKVEGPAQIDALTALSPDLPVWCMMETPRGALNALTIADHPAVGGFVMGTNDLAKDIGCATGGDRAAMQTAVQMCVLAARAAGLVCIDGVYNAFRDTEGLTVECRQGREWGMDGKTLIHPLQLETANGVFAPDADEVALATRQIAAFDEAAARGEGVAVVDGKIVENLHIETARKTLAKAEAIRAREAA